MAQTNYNNDGLSAEDKALNTFSDLIIQKIEALSSSDNWQQPWFTEGSLSWPKNTSGRPYNGQNALMLTLHCEKEGYRIPRFCTFDAIQRMNAEKKDLPKILVKKGEKSFPIFLTTFTCVNRDTKEKIPWEDYKKLSDDYKKQYNVYPRQHVFRVFNIDQTNLKEVRPELYAKFEAECMGRRPDAEGGRFVFEPLDRMIRDQSWICPIKPTYGNDAYFSISRNEIIVPEPRQFADGESFAGTCFHEMTHSLGTQEYFDRLKPTTFGSDVYATEELVAELSAALVCMRYGMSKNLKSDSAPYLKAWLDSLHESPQFLKTLLGDVKKSSGFICQHIDKIQQQIDAERAESVAAKTGIAPDSTSQGIDKPNEEAAAVEVTTVKPTEQEVAAKMPAVAETQVAYCDAAVDKGFEPVYYSSLAYMQMPSDCREFERMLDKGDYEGILHEATEYDFGDAPDLEETYMSPTQNPGDDLLIEDGNYAVVHNPRVGGTFEVFRKYTESEIRASLIRYGLPDYPTMDVRNLESDMRQERRQQEATATRGGFHR